MTLDSKEPKLQDKPCMIGIDWGTSSLRAYLLGQDGIILKRKSSNQGILNVENNNFQAVFDNICQSWLAAGPNLPVLMSGMIGSRQGWFEVPYRRCPVTIESIALGSHCVSSTDMPIRIVPGIEGVGISGAPDVMRGEETQISGALSIANINEGILCIPGTHSKWVNIKDRSITGFSTFMTGETYAVLKDHSILGKLFTASRDNREAFLEGVKRAGSSGGLLHQLFGVRSEGIANTMKAGKLASFMSGLLIGSEIIEACRAFKGQTANIYLVATNEMADLYQRALQANQFTATLIDSEKAAAKGLWASARVTGLI